MLIIVAITISSVGILWYVVNNLIEESMKGSDCIKTFEKVLINNYYTCNDSSTQELRISVELKDVSDIDISKVIVTVSGDILSKNFEIPANAGEYDFVGSSSGIRGDALILPLKNSAKIYYMNVPLAGIGEPSKIEIAPVIGDYQCEISDQLLNIDSCDSIFT